MRKLLMMFLVISFLALPVKALELEVPAAPESAAQFMPSQPDNLGAAFCQMITEAILAVSPSLKEAASGCLGIFCAAMILSIIRSVPGSSERSIHLAGTVLICTLFLGSVNSFVKLAGNTVSEISEYGKMLLPVMTAALAAQGGVNASAALYAGTSVFNTFLTTLIVKLLIPMIYLYLALAGAKCAAGEELLKKLSGQLKGAMTWMLKTILYIYTGYITITGVISGTTDAAALKAAKLTISGMVPVVGGILSDASEAVLVGAGTIKNGAGLYGMFAILAIWIGPFVRIGVQYLLMKTTGTVCGIFCSRQISDLIEDFSSAMGFLLAMTGAVCLMLLISLVCFMKGVG